MVNMRYEHNLTSVSPNFRKNCTFLDKTSSHSQLHYALWTEVDFVNTQCADSNDTHEWRVDLA